MQQESHAEEGMKGAAAGSNEEACWLSAGEAAVAGASGREAEERASGAVSLGGVNGLTRRSGSHLVSSVSGSCTQAYPLPQISTGWGPRQAPVRTSFQRTVEKDVVVAGCQSLSAADLPLASKERKLSTKSAWLSKRRGVVFCPWKTRSLEESLWSIFLSVECALSTIPWPWGLCGMPNLCKIPNLEKNASRAEET